MTDLISYTNELDGMFVYRAYARVFFLRYVVLRSDHYVEENLREVAVQHKEDRKE